MIRFKFTIRVLQGRKSLVTTAYSDGLTLSTAFNRVTNRFPNCTYLTHSEESL